MGDKANFYGPIYVDQMLMVHAKLTKINFPFLKLLFTQLFEADRGSTDFLHSSQLTDHSSLSTADISQVFHSPQRTTASLHSYSSTKQTHNLLHTETEKP
jgi:hypothetical protein